MIALNGRQCSSIELHVPWRGRWTAAVVLPGAAPSGRVTLTWGAATLIGSVEPGSAGTWQDESRAHIVGGLGWASVLPAAWLQNDAGLVGASLAAQVAKLAGETLAAPPAAFRSLRTTYPRPRRQAGATLNDLLASSAIWWVDFSGTTRAGVRPAPTISGVEITDLEPKDLRAELDADDVGPLVVGGVVPAAPPRRPSAYRIVELMARADGGGQRFTAYLEAA